MTKRRPDRVTPMMPGFDRSTKSGSSECPRAKQVARSAPKQRRAAMSRPLWYRPPRQAAGRRELVDPAYWLQNRSISLTDLCTANYSTIFARNDRFPDPRRPPRRPQTSAKDASASIAAPTMAAVTACTGPPGGQDAADQGADEDRDRLHPARPRVGGGQLAGGVGDLGSRALWTGRVRVMATEPTAAITQTSPNDASASNADPDHGCHHGLEGRTPGAGPAAPASARAAPRRRKPAARRARPATSRSRWRRARRGRRRPRPSARSSSPTR